MLPIISLTLAGPLRGENRQPVGWHAKILRKLRGAPPPTTCIFVLRSSVHDVVRDQEGCRRLKLEKNVGGG
jgi:hypothetical protein